MATQVKAAEKPLAPAAGDDKTKGDLVNLQQQNLPAVVDFGEDAGVGMENIDKSEVRIAWLAVLQSNSPQCDESANRDRKSVV